MRANRYFRANRHFRAANRDAPVLLGGLVIRVRVLEHPLVRDAREIVHADHAGLSEVDLEVCDGVDASLLGELSAHLGAAGEGVPRPCAGC